jgi:tryptophan-rich sensory protein
MGISSYLVCANNTDKKFKKRACTIYIVQLVVNALWSLFFFRLKWYLLSLVWLVLLLGLVIWMAIKFYKIKPLAGYLQVPYILWSTFALILTYAINRIN